MNWLFASTGQSIGASAPVLPMTRIDFLWNWLVWSPWSPRDSQESSPAPQFKSSAPILWRSAFSLVQLAHSYMTSWKTIALTMWTFVGKIIRHSFSPKEHLLISWLQSPSTMILEPKKIESVTVSTFSPFYLPWSDGTGCHDLSFLDWVLWHLFFSSFTLIKMLFSSSSSL